MVVSNNQYNNLLIERISDTPIVLIPISPVIQGSPQNVVSTSMNITYSFTAPFDMYIFLIEIVTSSPILWYGYIGQTQIGGTTLSPATIYTANQFAFVSPFLPKLQTGETIKVYAEALVSTTTTITTVNFSGFRLATV